MAVFSANAQQQCIISPVASRIPTILKCEDAVYQKENGDLSRGLLISLHPRTKAVRKTNFSQVFTEEIIHRNGVYLLGKNEGNMKDVHGMAAKAVRQHFKSIHQQKSWAGTSPSYCQAATEKKYKYSCRQYILCRE
jgi:hypothetical protein